jgi:hypothetical protein
MSKDAIHLATKVLEHPQPVPLGIIGFGLLLIVIFFFFPPLAKYNIFGDVILGFVGVALIPFGLWRLSRTDAGTVESFQLPAPWTIPISHSKYVPNNSCNVLHSLDPLEYSAIAAKYAEKSDTKTIFTVCGIEPHNLIRELERKRTNAECDDSFSLDPLYQLGERGVQQLADGLFPHFRAFRTFHSTGRGRIIRIILDTGNGWTNRNRETLALFKWLNADIDCYVVKAKDLRNRSNNVHFLTDFVVFNSELFVDYYDDSETLIVTHDNGGALATEFMGLENNFIKYRDTPLYARL